VSFSATPQEITEAYRKIVIKVHPDKPEGSSDLFHRAQEAYKVLRDPARRKDYDEMLIPPEPKTKSHRVIKGENLRVTLRVATRDLVHCINKSIQTTRMGLCPKCNGTRSESGKDKICHKCGGAGYEPISMILSSRTDCTTCRGRGLVPEGPNCPNCRGLGLVKETIKRDITLNPVLGSTMTLFGSGNCCPHGGQPGNLSVEFIVEKDPIYTIHGLKVRRQLKINPAQAVLGDEIEIDVFGTPVDVLVPSGSQPGRILEIEGAGLSYQGRRGDLEIQLWVNIPDVVDETHRELYERIRDFEKERNNGRVD